MGAVPYQALSLLQYLMHNVGAGEVQGKGEGEPGNEATSGGSRGVSIVSVETPFWANLIHKFYSVSVIRCSRYKLKPPLAGISKFRL